MNDPVLQFHSDKVDAKFGQISNRSNHNYNDQGRYKNLFEKVTELENRRRQETIGLADFLNKIM